MQSDNDTMTVLCQAADVRLQLNSCHAVKGESITHKICGFMRLQIVHANVLRIADIREKMQIVVAQAPQTMPHFIMSAKLLTETG